MNHRDTEKLAADCWDAVSDTPYAATTVDHKLRLCSVVNSVQEQLDKESGSPTTNIAGLEDFEGEVIRRLTALVPVAKELEPEAEPEPTSKKAAAPKKSVAKKK